MFIMFQYVKERLVASPPPRDYCRDVFDSAK